MKAIVWGSSFKHAYKKAVRRHPTWRRRIADTLDHLAEDPFLPRLDTHKLKGDLVGLWACTVAYDCRLVFEFVRHPGSGDDEILLIDIGTHDEVY